MAAVLIYMVFFLHIHDLCVSVLQSMIVFDTKFYFAILHTYFTWIHKITRSGLIIVIIYQFNFSLDI